MESKGKHPPNENRTALAGTRKPKELSVQRKMQDLLFFLDSLILKVNECKTEIIYSCKLVTSEKVMDYALGKITLRIKVLKEFQRHNDE